MGGYRGKRSFDPFSHPKNNRKKYDRIDFPTLQSRDSNFRGIYFSDPLYFLNALDSNLNAFLMINRV